MSEEVRLAGQAASAVRTHFVGWEAPALESIVDWLVESRRAAQRRATEPPSRAVWSDVAVVLPGRRAGRQLLERLAAKDFGEAEPFVPPWVLTPGTLLEVLSPCPDPVASDAVALLALARAIAEAPAARRAVLGLDAERTSLRDALGFAREIRRLEAELATAGYGVRRATEVATQRCAHFQEDRWLEIAALIGEARGRLADLGLMERTAWRIRAHRQEVAEAEGLQPRKLPWEQIVLGGLADPSTHLTRALDRSGAAIDVLVTAPAEEAAAFDRWGRPLPDAWRHRELSLAEAQVRTTGRLGDVGREAVAIAQEWRGESAELRASDVTVGVPDPRLMEVVAAAFEGTDLRVHAPRLEGTTGLRPVTLLALLARFAASRSAADFAALVRHADFERWAVAELAARPVEDDERPSDEASSSQGSNRRGAEAAFEGGDLLTFWDLLTSETATTRMERQGTGRRELDRCVDALLDTVEELYVGPLLEERLSLAAWIDRLTAILERVYAEPLAKPAEGAEEVELDELAEALASIGSLFAELREVGSRERSWVGRMTAREVVELVQTSLEERGLGFGDGAAGGRDDDEGRDDGPVELVGWLELPLDDRACHVIVGMNEGLVPAALPRDPLLPEGVRRALGLTDDETRSARDRFYLTALSHSRARLALVSARVGLDDEPLLPSRLLLSGPRELRARDVLRLVVDPHDADGTGGDEGEAEPLGLTPLLPLATPHTLPVTAFRDYLRCPYRFYLRHVLRVEPMRDLPTELDGALFGSLAHDVLSDFARGPLRASRSVDQIEEQLVERLKSRVTQRFGRHLPLSARVQVVQLERRLRAFAMWQVEQVAAGWCIDPDWVERALSGEWTRGGDLTLRGRIDRLDRHPDGRIRILDYKTADRPLPPTQAHFRLPRGAAQREWHDLQLPLYRWLAEENGLGEAPQVGYVQISKKLRSSPLQLFKLETELFDEAMGRAEDVARGVTQGSYWPPKDPPRYDDGYRALAGDGLAHRRLAALSPDHLNRLLEAFSSGSGMGARGAADGATEGPPSDAGELLSGAPEQIELF